MTFAGKLFNSLIITGLLIFNLTANDNDRKLPKVLVSDTTSIYQLLFNDNSDDLMEYHPADDIYSNIWTSTKLNPYKIPVDSLPDSVMVDLSNFVIPVPGAITSDFGPRRYRYHYGTDLRLNVGDSILSSFPGKVRIIDYDRGGYGHYIVIRHDNGLETVYAHLSVVLVTLDQNVSAGELIALGGNTGRSSGPHLHYEIRFLGNAMNPAKLIDFTTGMPFTYEYLITRKNSFYYQKEVKAISAKKYYRVKKGDNLGRIASRNGTSIKALCKLNGISSKKILKVGQSLRVR
jgi:LysM repeat protein